MQKHVVLKNHENHVSISFRDDNTRLDHLPPMVYRAVMTEDGPILIKDRSSFNVPEVVFGNSNKYFELITGQYDPQGTTLGIMLRGRKGSGKSLLGERICNWGLKRDLPVLHVASRTPAAFLLGVLSFIGPCIVYIDEYEKIYPSEEGGAENHELLPVLSDQSLVGVIFIITLNKVESVSSYLFGRPGRIRYDIVYKSLGQDVLDDVYDVFKVKPWLRRHCDYVVKTHGTNSAAINMDCLLQTIRSFNHLDSQLRVGVEAQVMNIGEFTISLPTRFKYTTPPCNQEQSEKYDSHLHVNLIFDESKGGKCSVTLVNELGEVVDEVTNSSSVDAVLCAGTSVATKNHGQLEAFGGTGHMGQIVDLGDGVYSIASDAVDVMMNMAKVSPKGQVAETES